MHQPADPCIPEDTGCAVLPPVEAWEAQNWGLEGFAAWLCCVGASLAFVWVVLVRPCVDSDDRESWAQKKGSQTRLPK